jgi:peptide/nickel transport system substrate-binding protein
MKFKHLMGALAAVTLAAGAYGLPAQAETPKRGGTLTLLQYTNLSALSTIATTAAPTSIVAPKIFESLLTYETADMIPRPGVAESWSSSDDKMTWTFKLRKDVKFHDGKPMTSADVKYSMDKVVGKFHSRGRKVMKLIESVEAPDDYTVVFKLKSEVPFFLKAFQPNEAPILPKHILGKKEYAKKKAIRQSPFMKNPVGTGPFRLVEFKEGSHIILERNPYYWKKGRPYLDKIVYRILPDDTSRVIALEKGEADVATYGNIPTVEIERLKKLDQMKATSKGMEAIGPVANITFNLRDKYMKNRKVRKAINLVHDRKFIVDVIFNGQARPVETPFFPGSTYYNDKLPPSEYNIDKANKLLDEAGFKRDSKGVRFKVTVDYTPYGNTWQRLAEYTKEQLKKIGIQGKIRNLDFGAWLKAIFTDWDFQMTNTFGNGYYDPVIGVARYYTTSSISKGASFTNASGWSNPEVDKLFDQAAKEIDVEKRKKMFFRIQEIMYEELPHVQLFALPTVTLFNKRVQNLPTNGISPYSGYADVWVK